jgi:hypothetical protein
MWAMKTKDKTAKFTSEERAAMRQRVKELKAAETGAEALAQVVAKLAEMEGSDRALGERLHALITAAAPGLAPRLWYGMPAYYLDGKLICHFQDAAKFKSRYATLGFSADAKLDDGAVWPVAYAVTKLTAADEARITALVKQAIG